MALTQIPQPPLRSNPDTFSAQMENFLVALPTLVNELNDVSSVADLSTRSTSTTSNTIGTGSKTFTVQTGLGYVPGHPIRIANTPAPTNFMDGIVTSYNTSTGSLVVNVTSVSGSGTFAVWSVMLLLGGGNFATIQSLTVQGIGDFTATSYLGLPSGTTAQRGTPARPSIRFNQTLTRFEGYNGSTWGNIGGGATGGGADIVFNLNSNVVTQSYSIPSGMNAGTFGPITVNDGVVISVPDNSTWSVV